MTAEILGCVFAYKQEECWWPLVSQINVLLGSPTDTLLQPSHT